MRQSHLFTKVQKHFPKDEQSTNAKWLIRGGFIDKTMAGVYSFLPLGLRVLGKIEDIIREEMNAVGGQEVLLPVLHPKENWETTGRWETEHQVLYKLKGHDKKELALGPTHEEILVPVVAGHVNSYQDLPLAIYQIQTKFRNELRAKSGLLRGREFLMKDLYSFHTNHKDFEKYYEKMKHVYTKLFRRLGLETKIVEASGGSFTKKFSHEFQVFTKTGEDIIFHCDCGFAQNKEIFDGDKEKKCPKCGKAIQKSKGIEAGNIFPLESRFSDQLGLTYKDKDGKEQSVLMGCYGIGIGRVMGTIIEVHNDENGMIWPAAVAPYHIHLLALGSERGGNIVKKAEKLYSKWTKRGIAVLLDDRKSSAGEKLTEADIIGIPWRAVISEKTGDKVEIKARSEKKSVMIDPQEVLAHCK